MERNVKPWMGMVLFVVLEENLDCLVIRRSEISLETKDI